MKTTAIIFEEANKVGLAEVEIPAPETGEVLVRTHYTFISPGTELRYLSGKQPVVPFPFIPGYAIAGEVIEKGPGTTLPIGAKVLSTGTTKANVNLAWGGQTALAINQESQLYRLPDDVRMQDAPPLVLAGTAYRGMSLGQPRTTDLVAGIGLGPVGHLSAILHDIVGATVVGIDTSPRRVDALKALGIEAFVPEGDLAESFLKRYPQGASIVVDCTGASAVLLEGMKLLTARPGVDPVSQPLKYVVQGGYPDEIAISYRAAFSKEVRMIFPRANRPVDIRAVLDLFNRGKLKPASIISEILPPAVAPEAYATLRDTKDTWLTVAFDWRSLK